MFLERWEERKRERESMCGCLSTPPTGDVACNPGMCRDWELNQQPFGSQVSAQSTEPHQPGPKLLFYLCVWERGYRYLFFYCIFLHYHLSPLYPPPPRNNEQIQESCRTQNQCKSPLLSYILTMKSQIKK